MTIPTGIAVATERINLVVAFYAQEIDREQKSGAPSMCRLTELLVRRSYCIDDRRSLDTADASEVLRLSQHYADLFRALTNPS